MTLTNYALYSDAQLWNEIFQMIGEWDLVPSNK